MAKNNGKFTLFFMLCALVLALCLVIGMDKCEYTAKKAVFETSNRVNTNLVENNINDKKIVNTTASSKEIEVLCLMYHNVVANTQKQGDYEVRVSTIEQDFIELKKLGYKCVNRKTLSNIVKNKKYGKYAMITFDDGFYGVYKYMPALLEKYNMSCVVSVVGEFMDRQDKLTYKTRCSYMNTSEVKELSKNPRVEIALHSYDYHHIKDGRRGVKIKSGESKEIYKETFKTDTIKLATKLEDIGIKAKTYCYPYGEFCRESENVLKTLNYQMTMTCAEKINYLSEKDSLYLLGRINRSANCKNINNLISKACNKK